MASSSSSSSPSSNGNGDVTKVVILKSSNGDVFEMKEAAANLSVTIKNMIDDGCADSEIPLPNVGTKELTKVIEYCNKHTFFDGKAEDLDKWDKEEFANVDTDTLYDFLLAANYLNVKGMLDLLCQKAADLIMGKSPDEIRKTFKIEKDFTAEEEAEMRKEYGWAW